MLHPASGMLASSCSSFGILAATGAVLSQVRGYIWLGAFLRPGGTSYAFATGEG